MELPRGTPGTPNRSEPEAPSVDAGCSARRPVAGRPPFHLCGRHVGPPSLFLFVEVVFISFTFLVTVEHTLDSENTKLFRIPKATVEILKTVS